MKLTKSLLALSLIGGLVAAPSFAHGTKSSTQSSQYDVKDVQQKLQDKGYDVGQINGKMDTKTKDALKKFQKDNDLSVTGRIDQQTASALGFSSAQRGVAGKQQSDTMQQQPSEQPQEQSPSQSPSQPQGGQMDQSNPGGNTGGTSTGGSSSGY